MRIGSSVALVGSLQFGISGTLDCHIYAVRGPRGVVLGDAGGGSHGDVLLFNVEFDFGVVRVDSIVITHAHADHCAGAAELQPLTGARVIGPSLSRGAIETGDEEAMELRAAREAAMYPRDFKLRPCSVDEGFRDDTVVEAAGLRLRAIHLRGHSEDSFGLLTEIGKRLLFAGDIVFYGGVLGVVNYSGSGMAGYRADLPKLAGLSIDGLFPRHGLFTLRDGQRHINCAIDRLGRTFLPGQIGQGDVIF